MDKPSPSIDSIREELEAEYLEPLPEIIAGYIAQGTTRRDTAGALECSFLSFRKFCQRENIHFPSVNERRRRGGHFVEESEKQRRAGISWTKRSNTRQISFEGETMCLSDWADTAGIPRNTLQSRIARGVSFGEALHPANPDMHRTR